MFETKTADWKKYLLGGLVGVLVTGVVGWGVLGSEYGQGILKSNLILSPISTIKISPVKLSPMIKPTMSFPSHR